MIKLNDKPSLYSGWCMSALSYLQLRILEITTFHPRAFKREQQPVA